MKIYNLFPLLAGPFGDWKPHLKRAADMGFDWVFVNPIQQPGHSGSLYSIADYFKINPNLLDPESDKSPETQVRQMVAQANDLGMRMMIDLVINHCAVDSSLVKEHPEWCVREGDRLVNPYCLEEDGSKTVWGDLAQLDHRHSSDLEGLRRYLSEVILYLVELGFTGFRCDAAYQIPGTSGAGSSKMPGAGTRISCSPPRPWAAHPMRPRKPPPPASTMSSTAPSGGIFQAPGSWSNTS